MLIKCYELMKNQEYPLKYKSYHFNHFNLKSDFYYHENMHL